MSDRLRALHRANKGFSNTSLTDVPDTTFAKRGSVTAFVKAVKAYEDRRRAAGKPADVHPFIKHDHGH